ncbi:MAG: aminotransferase class I/II-fold pyridoxal phosphate-dependent enzyme [Muribaculaceae bacterium]|nr:aminotransferase class I/II-fold pyridoxal phosphate-dependent enzyme [Muribaculaceae bacterium]
MEQRILLSMPQVAGTEQKYIDQAMADHWIVPLGPHVDEFEHRLENFLGNGVHVVALSSGTAAIHLALVLLGVGPGDEVICQDLTFSASANPIVYCGASPVFVDSETSTMNMDPDRLEEAIIARRDITGRLPKAIIPVHLYGMPAQMDRIMDISDRYGIPVVEDAAEALGSEFKGRMCGTIGRFGILSFNGNKMITTSGGGALICPDRKTAERARFLATQARENRPYYYHEVTGYNYRLSNISAAIGCGQTEVLRDRIERRRDIHRIYASYFATSDLVKVHSAPSQAYNSNYWLTTVGLTEADPELTRQAMAAQNIETRLLWRPMSMQPVFADAPCYGSGTAESLFNAGLCLPLSLIPIGRCRRLVECRCRWSPLL